MQSDKKYNSSPPIAIRPLVKRNSVPYKFYYPITKLQYEEKMFYQSLRDKYPFCMGYIDVND
jgi:hypothetical protein